MGLSAKILLHIFFVFFSSLMGCREFWNLKFSRHYFKCYQDLEKILPYDIPVIVDMSVIIRILWERFRGGSRLFFAEQLGPLVFQFYNEIECYLGNVIGGRKRILVFEGDKPEAEKFGREFSVKGKSRLLSKAIRLIKLGPEEMAPIGEAILDKKVSPFGIFSTLLMQHFAKSYEVIRAKGESDYAISYIINHGFENAAVLSSDADYLLFSRCKFLITPQYRYRSVIFKDQILKDLNISGPDLTQFATLTGQDHIKKLKGFGAVKAYEVCCCLNSATLEEAWKNLYNLLPASKDGIAQSKIVCSRFHPGIAGASASKLEPKGFATESLFDIFINETKTDAFGNVVLRRGSLKEKLSKGIIVKESTSKITAAERRLKMIEQRKTMVAKVVQDKSFVFHFNPYSLISEVTAEAHHSTVENLDILPMGAVEDIRQSSTDEAKVKARKKSTPIGTKKRVKRNEPEGSSSRSKKLSSSYDEEPRDTSQKKRKRKSETIFRDEMRCLYASAVRDLGSVVNVMSQKLIKLKFLQFFQKAYQEIKVHENAARMTMLEYLLKISDEKLTNISKDDIKKQFAQCFRERRTSQFTYTINAAASQNGSLYGGNIQSLMVTRLKDIVIKHVKGLLKYQYPEISLNNSALHAVSSIITVGILGKKGPLFDEDEEECDDGVHCGEVFEDEKQSSIQYRRSVNYWLLLIASIVLFSPFIAVFCICIMTNLALVCPVNLFFYGMQKIVPFILSSFQLWPNNNNSHAVFEQMELLDDAEKDIADDASSYSIVTDSSVCLDNLHCPSVTGADDDDTPFFELITAVQDEEEEDYDFPSVSERLMEYKRKQGSKLSKSQKRELDELCAKDDDSLFSNFMPIELSNILQRGHSGYRLLVKKKLKMGQLLMLVKNINVPVFTQSLAPGPNVQAKLSTITSSILIGVIYDFTKSLTKDDREAFFDALNFRDHPNYENFYEDWDSLTVPVKLSILSNYPFNLWKAIFPAISEFEHRNDCMVFDAFAQSNGVKIHFGFRDKSKEKARKENKKGVTKYGQSVLRYSHSNYLKYMGNEKEKLDLCESVGCRDHSKELNGLGSIKGGKGTLWLEKVLDENLIEHGPETMKRLVSNHPFVCIDLGVINEISMVTTLASFNTGSKSIECINVPYKRKTASRYDGTGINKYLFEKAKNAKQVEDKVLNLAVNHNRTLDPAKYEAFRAAFEKDGQFLLDENFKMESLNESKKLENRIRSHWATIPNTILEFVDETCRANGRPNLNAPILIVGIPTFSATMKGKKSVAPKKIIEYLKRFFTVVLINEDMSSQLCPCCLHKMQKLIRKSTRVWFCDNPRCWRVQDVRLKRKEKEKEKRDNNRDQASTDEEPPSEEELDIFIVNKDISAAVNFFQIFMVLMTTGTRPEQFISEWSKSRGIKKSH